MYRNAVILISALLFLLGGIAWQFTSCRKTPTEPSQPSISLEAEDVSVTEVWLRVKAAVSDERGAVRLVRDTTTIFILPDSLLTTHHSPLDTLIIDEGLLPKYTYTYTLTRTLPFGLTESTRLTVTTMDTTSHEITWVIDTLGGIQSRVNGLWGSGVNNVYAVGKFQLDTTSHLASWDGSKWTYLRPDAINDWYGIGAGELTNIFGVSSNKIWVVGYRYGYFPPNYKDSIWGFVAELNGTQWKKISPNAPGEYFISIWASSENDIWITTAAGFVYHYNNGVWEKLSTGTNYYFSDIWGFSNKEIYIVGGPTDYSTGIVLKYNGQNWERINVLPPNSIVTFESIWGTSNKYMFVASDGGLFTNNKGMWSEIIYPGLRSALVLVRGSGKNNVFVCGHLGKLLHYNGHSWKNYETQFGGSDIWILQALYILNNTAFIGGVGGEGFDRRGIILRGRR